MFRPASYLSGALPEVKVAERRRGILVVTPFSSGPAECVALHLAKEIAGVYNFDFIQAASPLKSRRFPVLAAFSRARETLKGLEEKVRRADIVWLHDAQSLASRAAYRHARAYDKPVFVTQHRGPQDGQNSLHRFAGWLADIWFARDLLRDARRASFTSDATADYYYRRIAFAAPVKIIPNGADVGMFHSVSTDKRKYLRGRFALRNDQPVLIHAGALSGEGSDIIRMLAERMKDWRFWLVGENGKNAARWFLPNVQVFPKRDGTAAAELYQAADLMILPRNGSSLPLAAQEAMACGLPVMCSPSLAEACGTAKPYLWAVDVFPGDPRATVALWSERLKAGQTLLPLEGAQTELSKLAESFWEWPQIASHYADILRDICRGDK